MPDMPLEVVVNVMRHMEFPGRLRAAEVSRKWRAASNDPCFSIRVEPPGANRTLVINEAIVESHVGGTVILAPGYYQETVIVSKAIRVVGETGQAMDGTPRKAVVVEGISNIAFVCSAPCHLEHLVIRTRTADFGRSALSFHNSGTCPLISMRHCEVQGATRIHLPDIQPQAPRLRMQDCKVTACTDRDHAILVSAGSAYLEGCTITGNRGTGIGIGPRGMVQATNCDISFNGEAGVAFLGSGRGDISNSVIWGNRTGAIDTDGVLGREDIAKMVGNNNHIRLQENLTMRDRILAMYIDNLAAMEDGEAGQGGELDDVEAQANENQEMEDQIDQGQAVGEVDENGFGEEGWQAMAPEMVTRLVGPLMAQLWDVYNHDGDNITNEDPSV